MAYLKHLLLSVTVMGVLCALVLGLPTPASAAQSTADASYEFNAMLVVDSSGSMDDSTSDPDGLRYDAVNLFYNLAPSNSTSIGLIAFSNTNLFVLEPGTSSETALETLLETPVTGGTNIGSAVYSAVTLLIEQQEENGLPSQVLLLSDGETDLGDLAALAESQEEFNNAILLAQNNDIAINVIWLNPDAQASVPDEIVSLTENTGGYYEQVLSADDLVTLFARFYAQLTNVQLSTTSASASENVSFESSLTGVKELAFLVECDPDATISITSPTGEAIALDSLTSVSMQDCTLIKITDPLVGIYTFSVSEDACITMVYSLDLIASVTAPAMTEAYGTGQSQAIQLSITDLDGTAISAVDYGNLTASIEVLTPQKETILLEPTATDSMLIASFIPEEQGYYYLTATINAGDVSFQSEIASFTIGNLAPIVIDDNPIVFQPIGLLFSGIFEYDLSGIFDDNEDATLSYRIVSVDTSPFEASTTTLSRSLLVGNYLAFHCSDLTKATLIVEAIDSAGGTAQTSIYVYIIPTGLLSALLILLIWGTWLLKKRKKTRKLEKALNGYHFAHRIFIRIEQAQAGVTTYSPFAFQKPFYGKLPFTEFIFAQSPSDQNLINGLNRLSFYATSDPDICEIHSANPFYWNGNLVRSVSINLKEPGSQIGHLRFVPDLNTNCTEQLYLFFSRRGNF